MKVLLPFEQLDDMSTDRKFKGPFEAGSEEGWGRR
jgi:hypothetical protein